MKRLMSLLSVSILMACSESPDALQPDLATGVTPQKQLEADAKSIEQAADEAVKLIEADAKSEIDASVSEDTEK